jgi:ATP-dependent Clp protease protease subunit
MIDMEDHYDTIPNKSTSQDAKYEAETRKLNLESEALELQIKKYKKEWQNISSNQPLNNIYMFYGPVTDGKVKDAIETLDMWSRREPASAMQLVFCSPGGSVFAGFALYDFIQELRTRGHYITTKTLGMAASMGATLLQAGDDRVISKNAYMMLHEISSGAQGTLTDVEDEVALLKRLQKRNVDLLCARSELTPSKATSLIKRKDCWIDADEALKLGLADRIQD